MAAAANQGWEGGDEVIDLNQLAIERARATEETLQDTAEMMASLGPYSHDECAEIIRAVVTCRPLSEVLPLIKNSHNDVATSQKPTEPTAELSALEEWSLERYNR